jgi:hypothetical protein
MTDTTVTGLADLMDRAGRKRGDCRGPLLLIVGTVSRSVDVDGTVVNRIGQADGYPAYEAVPRMYQICDDGGVEIMDDHPSWLGTDNGENEVISPDDAVLVVVVEPSNDEFVTPPRATNTLVYPPVSDE